MKVTDLQPNCKIKNKLWYELIIDKIIWDEIYTSWWNMLLTKFDRLRRTKQQVTDQMDKLGRVLLDGKIRITRKELQELVNRRIWWYEIKEFQTDTVRDDKDIIDKVLKTWDIVYTVDWHKFNFEWYIDNQTLLSVTIDWNKVNVIVTDDLLKHYTFSTKVNLISLNDVAEKLYGLPSDMILFTD